MSDKRPYVTIDNPNVMIINMENTGSGRWRLTLGSKNSGCTEILSISTGITGGNGGCNGNSFNYKVSWGG